jgi:hypothetical protein
LLPPVAADTSKQQGEAARLLSILESDGYQDSFGEVVTEDQRQSVLASMRKAPATLEAEARSMEALRLAIAGMMRHPRFFGPIDPYFFEKDSWRCLAEDIADALRLSFASTNPTTTLGASNDGPVPRFIAAVVPLITGESPNVGNVAQCLKTATRDKPKS